MFEENLQIKLNHFIEHIFQFFWDFIENYFQDFPAWTRALGINFFGTKLNEPKLENCINPLCWVVLLSPRLLPSGQNIECQLYAIFYFLNYGEYRATDTFSNSRDVFYSVGNTKLKIGTIAIRRRKLNAMGKTEMDREEVRLQTASWAFPKGHTRTFRRELFKCTPSYKSVREVKILKAGRGLRVVRKENTFGSAKLGEFFDLAELMANSHT